MKLLWLSVCGVLTMSAQNSDIKMTQFIDSLMNQMTLNEKLGQLNLSGGVGGLETNEKSKLDYIKEGLIGVVGGENLKKEQEIALQSRLGIPLINGRDIIHGYQTTFPTPLAMSCMWDLELIEKQARIAAIESTTKGINWTWSPMVDICRDPRWGRIAEGAGEDPWYGGLVGEAYVKGYQGDDLSKPNTMMACVKHFALYGAAEGGRDYNTIDMSRVVMMNDYLPPYKASFDAGAGSVMTSFNVVEGVPATGNKWLMNDLLRQQWGFDGLNVTDYTAIMEMMNHGVGEDLQEVSVKALKAGVDIDMMAQGYIGTFTKALQQGQITQEQIDMACRRVLEAKYKLGLFNQPFQYFNPEKAKKVILSKEHLQVAREISQRSIVLLKNENNILPLEKKGNIAVIGPFATSKLDMLGMWAATSDTSKSISILEGVRKVAGRNVNVLYSKGAFPTMDTFMLNRNNATDNYIVHSEEESQQMLANAKSVANAADVIIAVLGESRDWSGEAASRADIGLPDCQEELLKTLLATGKPVVLVLTNGRPMTLKWEKDNVPAIIEAWHGGTMAGLGIADVLFGDYNPSGKLTTSFPVSVGQIPIYYNHKPTGRPYAHKFKFTSKYLDIPNEPLFPFGYGLSYTQFAYSDITVNKSTLEGEEDVLKLSVTVSNTGDYDGEEVVQLYMNDPVASISLPVKQLKGFKKILFKKGESQKVDFTITPEQLKFYNSNLDFVWEEGKFNFYIGTNSSDVKATSVEWKK